VLLIVDDQAAETVDLGGMARQQQGGSVELRQDRRAGDAVAGAEPGAIVDRGVGPAGSQRDRLMPDDRGSRVPAGRQFRQLRRREHAERIDTQGHDLDRRVGLRKGVKALVPAVKRGDRGLDTHHVNRPRRPRHDQLEPLVPVTQARLTRETAGVGRHTLSIEPADRLHSEPGISRGDPVEIVMRRPFETGARELGL
jgi:hypothetical protein